MSVKLIDGKQHMVVKRDGRLEPYNPDKLRKVIHWATNRNELMTTQLLQALDIKIYDKIPIQKLFDEVIHTAANLISTLYPQWSDVARNLFLLKIYKEVWGLKKTGEYPDYLEVIRKGLEHGVYSKEVFGSFTEEELIELGNYIKPDRDFNFNYAGINIFFSKYCLNYSKTKKLELPQHAYMRVAIFSFWKERDKNLRLQLIKEKYDLLSTQTHTEATPKMLNSGTPKPQLASCVLINIDDDTYSIMESAEWAAFFSKYAGGLAFDISALRAMGSYVAGNRGISSGPVPFVKMIESIVLAFNQGGKRKGSAVITFPYWHYNAIDIAMLKDPGGPEHLRARSLQYAVKWYDEFTKAILNNEDIYLVDPKDAPKLYQTYMEEFSQAYQEAISKSNVRKKKVNAIELAYEFLKIRKETGNLYITFVDNINKQRMGELPINSSNLCQEITLPSIPSKYVDTKLEVYFNEVFGVDNSENEHYPSKIQFYKPGEIALCNLASIDLYWWYHASESDKVKLARNLLRSFDNGINYQYYPIIDGMYSNIRRRPIGIGAFNLAKLLAKLQLAWDKDDVKEILHNLFEDLTYTFLVESVNLAKERGAYHTIEGSKWKEGKVPIDVSILHNKIGSERPDLNRHLYKDWDYLRDEIRKYGVRFSYHFAIAPTANSVKAINATESTEPVLRLDPEERGVFSVPNIVPGLNQGFQYQIAWDIDPKILIDLAAIRQKFLDQAQSINLYYREVDSLHTILEDLIYAQSLGIKTLYYMKMPKRGELEVCESCAT